MHEAPDVPLVTLKGRIWSAGSGGVLLRETALALAARADLRVQIEDTDASTERSVLVDDDRRVARLTELCWTMGTAKGITVRYAPPDTKNPALIEGIWDPDPTATHRVHWFGLPYGYLPTGASAVSANRIIDQFWTPSRYVAATLEELGFDESKVASVPMGFAEDVFHPAVTPTELPTRKAFRFLRISIPYVYCKGIDLMLKAYFDEFSDDDDVCLVLQSRPLPGMPDLVANVQTLRHAHPNPPEVLHVGARSQAELAALCAACQCYLQTSRVEAFGMPVLEAMATGVPAIAVAHGGHVDFCTPDTAVLVPGTISGGEAERVAAEGLTSVREWCDVDLCALREAMRSCYEAPDRMRALGQTAAEVAREWSWRRTGESALAALRRLVA